MTQSSSVPTWAPTADQEAQARQALSAYLAALDAGQFQAAYALTAAGYRAHETEAAFAEGQAVMRAALGPVLERRLLKVTWSHNPARAPQPGVYAAVDISARFAQADRYCGYVVLRQPPEGGPFQVNTVVHAYLDNKTARSIVETQSIAALDATWTQAAAACPNRPVAAEAALPESEGGGIGYASVAAALAALRSQPGVSFRNERGWTIAEDMKNATVWSFAPVGHAAYPSAVKRQIVSQGSGSLLQMSISCEAAKEPCDALAREFEQLNRAALSGARGSR